MDKKDSFPLQALIVFLVGGIISIIALSFFFQASVQAQPVAIISSAIGLIAGIVILAVGIKSLMKR